MSVILAAGAAALFWLPTGRAVILPLARNAGNYFLDPMKIEIQDINGSIHEGFTISDLRIISGEENLFDLNYASISPDWDLITELSNGIPYVKNLEVKGVKTGLEKIMTIVNHFPSSEKDEDENNNDEETFDLKTLKINPFNLKIQDVIFDSEYADLALQELSLNESGKIFLNTDIISNEKILPVKINASMNFEPLEISSSDLRIGEKISAKFQGNLIPPFDMKTEFAVLNLDDIIKFLPEKPAIDFSGKIYGRVFLKTINDLLTASGVVSVPNGKVIDIPFNFRLPFNWNGKNLFELQGANLKTKAANVNLTSKFDIEKMSVNAIGKAENISLREIGKLAAPEAKLEGENGFVNFDISTVLEGDILSRTNGEFYAEMPSISAAGLRILKGFSANANLKPGQAPKLSLKGEIFNGKLFARGEAAQDSKGNIKPQAVISIVNLDVPTVIKTFPAAAKSISNPSGKITTRTIVADDLSIKTKITSDKLSINGITLNNIIANLLYEHQRNKASLEDFQAYLGRSIINASGNADLKSSNFKFNARANNFEPKIIRELKDISGIYNLEADASGKYTDLKTITANAKLNGKNVGYSGMTVGDLEVPINFANNNLNIANSKITLPGGSVNFRGNVNLSNTSNPTVDIAASSPGINLSRFLTTFKLQDKSMPVSGYVRGSVNVKGPVNNASVNANIRAENVKAGNLVNIPNAVVDVQGNTKKINVKRLEAKINDANINGNGQLTINQRNFNNSAVNIKMNVKNLELKPVLMAAMGSSPVTGNLNGNVNLNGTIAKPNLDLKLTSPIYANKMKIEDIAVNLKSPEQNHFAINAGARIDEFKLNADVDLKQRKDLWVYSVKTKPLDVDKAIKMQMPDMAGIAKGNLTVNVDGSTAANSPINIKVNSKELKIIDKIKIQDINVPVAFLPANNKIEIKNGKAIVNNGIINSKVNVDLNKSTWTSNVTVRHLDFGKLAQPFLPEGELIGSVDVDVSAKGNFGVMPTNFANGKFHTGSGYIHKMKIIESVSPTKRISFEKISGSFFWDGKDLFLNPGTQATAGSKEPLYRYFSINGSMGIPGKGLRLLCDGRFDLKILDQLLGAMKGLFQYVTGGLTGNVLRDAAGRVLGIKKRDFQNVTFTLANSWTELQLLNLKITKSLEEFLPINVLNKESEETQRSDTQFKMRLTFPVGQGNESVEDVSASDQFKEQLIDNLFNFGR